MAFDFNKIGKQMPYRVPEGFFDDLEAAVAQEVGMPATTVHRVAPLPVWRKALRVCAAVAAVAAIVIVTTVALPSAQVNAQELTVEQAFANLSDEDQEYLLDTYQDVTYISDQL
jgi:hypothetical protein